MNVKPIGYHTAQIAEATDASASPNAVVADGYSGDTDYPFADIKVLNTVGEFDPKTGFMLAGVPDGMGIYLLNNDVIRFIFQSESYGPIAGATRLGAGDSHPFVVNHNGASFTGSHVMYVDYDREKFANFMNNADSAEGMVLGAGDLIKNAYNLKGDLIGPRSASGCSAHPHFSNTDPNGCNAGWNTIMSEGMLPPESADWVMQSLCSAHLELKHQWGPGIGVEDDLFITNEEWTNFRPGANYTGIPAHVVDIATGNMYATGAFTLGGFEKIVEINCGHPDYVCFSPSGYNGNFGLSGSEAGRKNAMGMRPDGTPYVWPQDVVPSRLYIGKKGLNAKGEPANDFLSRNGLAYGQLYGFATDQAGGLFVDAYSKVNPPGSTIQGAFYPIDWKWDGEVKTFMHDGSWAFQHLTADGFPFWNSCGRDCAGSKTEHNSPDPYGNPRYVQGSTAGHFGIYAFEGITSLLNSGMPSKIPASYTLLQGEQDITSQIQLGGKGVKANGETQKTMSDTYRVSDGVVTDSAKVTFEDVDGLEWYGSSDSSDGYLVIQEDGGNDFGERTFLTKIETDGTPMTYYFLAQSGGDDNTRNKAGVGVPPGTNAGASAHEFSGSCDASGITAKKADGSWMIQAGDGYAKRQAEKSMPINEKLIVFGLQAHSLSGGVIAAFRGDRGGQNYIMRPKLPMA
mgnify:CR=1 FL=1|eukprot:scaffold71162_cov28-Tisochrysis_lutea.AAC.3